jgi:hypothetical protein
LEAVVEHLVAHFGELLAEPETDWCMASSICVNNQHLR